MSAGSTTITWSNSRPLTRLAGSRVTRPGRSSRRSIVRSAAMTATRPGRRRPHGVADRGRESSTGRTESVPPVRYECVAAIPGARKRVA